MDDVNLAAVIPQITPMDMGLGAQTTNATIGFMLLATGFILTRSAVSKKEGKKPVFPYTLDHSVVVKSGKANPEVHALLALLSFLLFGLAGTTLLLSGPGPLAGGAAWLQDLVNSAGQDGILSDLGAPGICLVLLLMALSAKTSYLVDFFLGALAGIIFPLGGGPWLETSRAVGQLGVKVYAWLIDLFTWIAGLNPLGIVGFVFSCLAVSWVWRNHVRDKVRERVEVR